MAHDSDSTRLQPSTDAPPPSEPRSPRLARWLIMVGVFTAALMAGGATAWWAWQSQLLSPAPPVAQSPVGPNTVPSAPTSPAPSAESPAPAEQGQPVQIYWLQDAGDRFELVPSTVTLSGEDPKEILTAAFNQVLAGSEGTTQISSIPAGTQLQSLEVKDDGIHVNLSAEFTTGGGSASMVGRVGQVIYTATTLDPTAPVWISVDGAPLEVLGGEGLLIDQPMTRSTFDQNFDL